MARDGLPSAGRGARGPEEALALEAGRAPGTARTCAGDTELAREVEELLAGESGGEGLEPPPVERIAWTMSESALGRNVGGYALERVLGSGGMGTVYLARREAEGFAQRVALKLVRRGLDDSETIRRFRTERALLAALQHERIARSTAAPRPRPAVVRDGVRRRGEPLDRWCDGRRLGTRARVALFLEVCEAVQHAHAKLVVHRDPKPANLLVARDGHVKLLDFGIAKLLESDAAETLTGQRALTPAYASPEQLRGEPITIASDIYSLGIVLYELLTGVRPFATPAALVTRPEPERPSTAVLRTTAAAGPRGDTGERLARELRGDLDTIMLKALHVDPARRYATVAALADDLSRHLPDDRAARPDTTSYRVRTLCGNRLAVGLAGRAFMALVAGFAGTLAMYLEADAQALAGERLKDAGSRGRGGAPARERRAPLRGRAPARLEVPVRVPRQDRRPAGRHRGARAHREHGARLPRPPGAGAQRRPRSAPRPRPRVPADREHQEFDLFRQPGRSRGRARDPGEGARPARGPGGAGAADPTCGCSSGCWAALVARRTWAGTRRPTPISSARRDPDGARRQGSTPASRRRWRGRSCTAQGRAGAARSRTRARPDTGAGVGAARVDRRGPGQPRVRRAAIRPRRRARPRGGDTRAALEERLAAGR
jgi:hypothetical protein